MPTLSILPMLQLGRKTAAIAPAPVILPPGPHRWELLLDEHDQCMKEVEDAFSGWLDRHHEKVRESRQWKDAHDHVSKKLSDTQMELANTKQQLQHLQDDQAGNSSRLKFIPPIDGATNSLLSLAKPSLAPLPTTLRNADHTRKSNGHSLEDNHKEYNVSKVSHRRNHQRHARELQSKMESYQVVLRWQERQTAQWRSRCDRQLSQIDGLLATVEQQKVELEQEQEQCDVLMDAVYHLIQKDSADDSIKAEKPRQVENHCRSRKDGRSVSYPDEFYCPLTQQLLVDPVIDHEGNTYEKSAIVEWLDLHETSPLTRNTLCKDQLIPNRVVKHAIAAWEER